MDMTPLAVKTAATKPDAQASGKFFGRAAVSGTGPFTHRDQFTYLLAMRYVLINAAAVALLAGAWFQGWIKLVMAADPTHQCTGIAIVFLAGFGLCTQRIWQVSQELNQARAPAPSPTSRAGLYLALVAHRPGDSRAIAASMLRDKLAARLHVVRHIGSTLVLLGLIGTVVGFIISLSGIKPDAAGDVKAVTPMITNLIAGMSVALYTTLVGALLNIWLMVNYQLLTSGTVRLVSAIVERGEAEATR
jgi:MotA/TolQ/ExbB proton channel family